MKDLNGGSVGCIGWLMLAVIAVGVVFAFASYGFAAGGGNIEPRLLSDDKVVSCGDNCNQMVMDGSHNTVTQNVQRESENAGGGVILFLLVAIVLVIFSVYALTAPSAESYY